MCLLPTLNLVVLLSSWRRRHVDIHVAILALQAKSVPPRAAVHQNYLNMLTAACFESVSSP